MNSVLRNICALLATTTPILAHWTYDRIIVNGTVIGQPYEHVRHHNNTNIPLQNVNATSMRCNINGDSGANTSVYTVSAGSTLGFAVADTFGHPGPQQVYISRAPGDDVKSYDGSGEWAKIYTLTYTLNGTGGGEGVLKWATYRAQTFEFKLPAELEDGEYLLRPEGLALHAAHKKDNAQFYVACAQIRVTGGGKGVPGPTIKFPGGYKWDSPGVLIPGFWSQITNYTSPGPKLWPEGTPEEHVLVGKVKQPDR
ncbi:hypothetical protein P280DRAFT_524742 [Massarina eburnea CBS 473.64]|uniref:lytic cellulose monooxygenase (C4-dehydrogenating) n=1 Tax=Massarina eburnea CBS 473.64 TaxID=1395130 RepID=A0A6A6SDV3_9PLEO|nr:hypothetical protein P280DRAFT_524742 [Massarina eburnea CBS 473.64]